MQFGKQYDSVSEFNARLKNFISTNNFIEEHNAATNKHWVAGHNQFSDWS